MNIFNNKKTKQQHEEQQSAKMQVEQLIREYKNKLVSKSFVDGFLYCQNFLFEKYLKNFSDLSDIEKEQVKNNLMNEIIDGNQKYLKNKNNKE